VEERRRWIVFDTVFAAFAPLGIVTEVTDPEHHFQANPRMLE